MIGVSAWLGSSSGGQEVLTKKVTTELAPDDKCQPFENPVEGHSGLRERHVQRARGRNELVSLRNGRWAGASG